MNLQDGWIGGSDGGLVGVDLDKRGRWPKQKRPHGARMRDLRMDDGSNVPSAADWCSWVTQSQIHEHQGHVPSDWRAMLSTM